MSVGGIRPRRLPLLAGVVALFLAIGIVLGSQVDASAAAAEQIRILSVDETLVLDFTDPCTGAEGTATVTLAGLFHLVVRPTGTFILNNNAAGTFLLEPDDPSAPDVTGRFATVDIDAGGANDVETNVLVVNGTASDGTPFEIRFLFHFTENAISVVILSFTKGC